MLQKTINTGIRLTEQQKAKLDKLAESLNVSRNHTICLLIDNAVIEQLAIVNVPMITEKESNDGQ